MRIVTILFVLLSNLHCASTHSDKHHAQIEIGKKDSPSRNSTYFLQEKINYAAKNGKKLIIKAGDYMIDGLVGLNIPSNSEIEFEIGASLTCIPNGSQNYRLINIAGSDKNWVKNIKLINPTIIGDRDSHFGSEGEHGHGLVITKAQNVTIVNPNISNCWGDGLAIYGGHQIIVENLKSNNNRRQGLTITSGRDIQIINPVCTNTNGTSPEAGIDIEPNSVHDELEDISILNPITKNNKGAGIIVSCKQFKGSTKTVTISIRNHVDTASTHGFNIGPLEFSNQGKLDGWINNINGRYYYNKQNGIVIRNYTAQNSPKIYIEKPYIENSNSSGQVSPRWGAGISFFRELRETTFGTLGNVEIQNPTIIDNRRNPVMLRGIYAVDDQEIPMENFKVIDPEKVSGIKDIHMIDFNADGITLQDRKQSIVMNRLEDVKLYSSTFSNISNEGASKRIDIFLGARKLQNSPLVIKNMTQYGVRIIPEKKQAFKPYFESAAYAIETREIGSSIKLSKNNENYWIIESMKGEWQTINEAGLKKK